MSLTQRVNTIVALALAAAVLFALAGFVDSRVLGLVCFDVCPFRESLFTILAYTLIPFLPGVLCATIAWLLCVSSLAKNLPRARISLLVTPLAVAALLAVFALVGYSILPVDESGRLVEHGIEPYMLLWAASITILFIAWASETAWLARSHLRWQTAHANDGDGQPTSGL